MFRLRPILFNAIIFSFITSTVFLDGVEGKGILRLRPPGVDPSFLTSRIAPNRTFLVDINGPENYRSIQGAIDSVPEYNRDWVVIHVKEGIYRFLNCKYFPDEKEHCGYFDRYGEELPSSWYKDKEKVKIPREKPHIYLRGSGSTKTVVVWAESSENNYQSSTFKVEAPNFIAYGISFKNDAPTGIANTSHNQSVAAYVGADKVAFYSCGFDSNHNTLLDNKGRHYYDNCYIQGAIDIIFGRARSIFHECEIFVITDQRTEIQGSVTAHTRSGLDENTGFVFVKGSVYGTGHAFLGRPRGDHSRVIFAYTYLSKTVRPEGWSDWNHHGSTENLYHAECNCHGPGADTSERAPWLKKLSQKEAAPFVSTDFIDGRIWLFVGHST